jgi:hypothetical protein
MRHKQRCNRLEEPPLAELVGRRAAGQQLATAKLPERRYRYGRYCECRLSRRTARWWPWLAVSVQICGVCERSAQCLRLA